MTRQSHRPTSAELKSFPARAKTAPETHDGLAHAQFALGNIEIQQLLTQGSLQPKLAINPPDDQYEREADSLAHGLCHCGQQLVPGGQCPSCSSKRPTIQRLQIPNSPAPQTTTAIASVRQEALNSPGRPLDTETRGPMEHGFGRNLSHVRIHTDSTAANSAAAIKARAFTVGSDIVFGAGEFAPNSTSGRNLLAHELTHVFQQGDSARATIQRQPTGAGMTSSDAPVAAVAPQPVDSSTASTNSASAQQNPPATGEFDPCAVNERTLTNADLLVHWQRTETYINPPHRRGEGAYYDYANLMRRLIDERRRRVAAGHIWLAVEHLSAVPSQLYELRSSGPLAITVVLADAAAEAGAPTTRETSSVMTPSQFEDYLQRQNVPHVDVEGFYARIDPATAQELHIRLPPPRLPPTVGVQPLLSPFGPTPFAPAGIPYSGVAGTGLYASPYDLFTRGSFLRNVYSPNVNMANPESVAGAELNWRGHFPEAAVHASTYGDLIMLQDLNRVAPNFPVFDTTGRGSPDRLISTTHSLPDASGTVSMDHYLEKIRIMSGNLDPHGTNVMGQAMTAINAEYGTNLNLQQVNERNFLAVPDDHVALVRGALVDRIQGGSSIRASPNAYSNLLDAVLRANPQTINGVQYTSWAQVETARTANAGAGQRLNRAEYLQIRQALAPLAAQRVIPAGISTPQIIETLNVRTATQQFGPGAMNIIAPPELLEMRRAIAGGEAPELARSRIARGSAGRGAVMGGGVAIITGAGQLIFDDGSNPHLFRDVAINVPMNAAGGAAQAWAETQINMRMTNSLLTRAMAPGLSGGSTAVITGAGLAGRTLASTGVGALAAPAVTLGTMGVQQLFFGADYTRIDYAAIGSRTAVAGGAAAGGGFLAVAGTGALLGSEVPIAGNIVGFIVGGIVYLVVDNAVGSDIEQSVRTSMGEQGCVPRPAAPAAPTSTPQVEPREPSIRGCFGTGTRIECANGVPKPIEQIVEGDMVLAFDVNTGELGPAKVISAECHGPARCIRLDLSDGNFLEVTPNHPLAEKSADLPAWTEVGKLHAGCALISLDLQATGVETRQIETISECARPTIIYDIAVETHHNFFANGILAHNKNI